MSNESKRDSDGHVPGIKEFLHFQHEGMRHEKRLAGLVY